MWNTPTGATVTSQVPRRTPGSREASEGGLALHVASSGLAVWARPSPEEERLLIGAGHVPILSQLAISSPEFRYVPLSEVLGGR